MLDTPHYVFDGQPKTGETREVAPGIFWLRMPLPFRLDHINLWLLDDGDGWTVVDCGIAVDDVKAAWEAVFAAHVTPGKPVRRLIVTHFHPDHMGLAGWLTARFGIEMWAPIAEWAFGRLLCHEGDDETNARARGFYARTGLTGEAFTTMSERGNPYRRRVTPIPGIFRRIGEGDTITIGGKTWRVIVGRGHSPEHACLYREDGRVLISGDQILPKISPNVSVWPQEPEGNPLALFLASIDRFRSLPADTLVLPSHNWPFTGLAGRLDQLAHHHDERLEETAAACARPATVAQVQGVLFRRQLDVHQLGFAVGESLAHLHYLAGQGRLERRRDGEGPDLFTAA